MKQRCYQSAVIPASIESVWGLVSDFHDLSWARHAVASCEPIGKRGGNEVGAQRRLNGKIEETLREIDGVRHLLRYSVDQAPPPLSSEEVSNYLATVHLFPVTEGDSSATFLEWYAEWEASSDRAVGFCHGLYVALLSALVDRFTPTETN